MKKFSLGLIILVLGIGFIGAPAQTLVAPGTAIAGESAAAFYRGKILEFVVTNNPGGGYDIAARVLTPYLAKHLGATIVVKNEPGAGGKVALNRLAKVNDGLSIIMMATREPAMAQVFGESGVKFDLGKFNWLATMSMGEYVTAVANKPGYRTFSELQNIKEVKFGAPGRKGGKATRPMLLGHIMGINVKLISGYGGTSEEILAMIRGEVDGVSVPLLAILPYINSQAAIPLAVVVRERFKRLPNTPTIYEIKKLSAEEKRIADIAVALDAVGRCVATTPGVPKDRVAFLDSALKKALGEPELMKKFEKLGETIDYASGKETTEDINLMLSIKESEKKVFGNLLGVEGF